LHDSKRQGLKLKASVTGKGGVDGKNVMEGTRRVLYVNNENAALLQFILSSQIGNP
jgi:hypothetical protein